MDAAEYKHLVLGLIFLKYISDRFETQRQKIQSKVSEPASDYYLGDNPDDHHEAMEDRDHYTSDNVFYVPQASRWEYLRSKAKQPDIGQLIDQALAAIEKEKSISTWQAGQALWCHPNGTGDGLANWWI